jgi:hypothetical protein
MKAKFLLTLLTLTGLLLSANGVFAATGSTPDRALRITNLSQTIAKLIDLEDRSLVELAIDRALLAQQVNEPQITTPVTAGVPRADLKPTEQKPTVRGRINKIKQAPIGQTKKSDAEPSIGQSKKN